MQNLNRLPVIIEDIFTDNRHNWELVDTDYNSNYFEDGKYIIDMKGGWATITGALPIDYSRNFVIEVRMRFISGADNLGYGICWGEDRNNNLHLFHISSKGWFSVGYEYHNNYSRIKDWQASEFIYSGSASNNLRVEKLGDTLTYYINEKPVFETFFTRAFGDRSGFVVHKGMKVAVEMYKVYGYQVDDAKEQETSGTRYAERMKQYFEECKNNLPKESGYRWHVSEKYKVVIQVPDDWVIKEDIDPYINVIALSPLLSSHDNFQENMNLYLQDISSLSLQDDMLYDAFIEQSRAMITGYDLLEKGMKKIDMYDSRSFVYTGMVEGIKIKNTAYCIHDEVRKMAYYIHCNVKATEFDRYTPIFEKILRNLKIFNY